MNYDLAAEAFLNHLQIERGLAKNTIAAYKRDLEKFSSFLQDKDLRSVTPEEITVSWLTELSEEPEPSTALILYL